MDQLETAQINEQLKQLSESLKQLGTGADETQKTLSDQLGKKFPNAARPTIAALEGLGSAITDTTKAIYKGERGMKVMADGVDKLADGVQAAVAVFTLFTPMGKALSLTTKVLLNGAAALGKVFSGFAKLSAEQSDALFKTYQQLSQIGAGGASGLQGLMDMAHQAGFTAAELDQFADSIRKNAKELGFFGGSVSDGAKNLTTISGAIVKSDLGYQLEMMGMSAKDIASSTATYMVLQSRLGRLQYKTATEVAVESAKFALELDKMARLTGQSREEQEAQRRALLEDERYAGFLASGEAAGNITALESFFGLIKDPETRRGLQHLIASGGAATSDQARQVMMTDPAAFQRMQSVLSGQMTPAQAAEQFSKQAGGYARTFGKLAAIGAEGPGVRIGGEGGALMQSRYFENLSAAAKKAGMTIDQFAESEQGRAMIADEETRKQVETRRAQMNVAQNLDAFVREGVGPATSALNALAKAANSVSNTLPGKPAGGGATTTAPGGAVSGAMGAFGGTFGAGNLAGLPIKSAEATAGGETPAQLAALAQTIYGKLGTNIRYFSAFNDRYHQGLDRYSAHTQGKALDFTLRDPMQAESVAAMVRNLPGVTKVINEYAKLSPGGTGGHIHAEISARNGWEGTLSGPSSGYRPNLLMHDRERIKITPQNGTNSMNDPNIVKMDEQNEKMDEMISLLKTSNTLQSRLLQMQN